MLMFSMCSADQQALVVYMRKGGGGYCSQLSKGQWGPASTVGFDIGRAKPVPCDCNDRTVSSTGALGSICCADYEYVVPRPAPSLPCELQYLR